jgi:ABC-type dipeptide/oligopeptide/nickel transport system permease component
MGWASIERHILIFNDRWLATKSGRFLAHYLPLIVILIYIFIFYIYVLFIFPCENTYAYDLPVCNAYPCYQNNPILGMWDFIGHNVLPGFLVAFVSVALLIRVIRQK